MKLLRIAILIPLLAAAAQSRQSRCMRAGFSGVASQDKVFHQELGEGLTLTVLPMKSKEDARWGWFQLKVLCDTCGYVFNPSDANWLLATDFNSAFIGGPNTDVKAALEYRTRYMIFPSSVEDKERLKAVPSGLQSVHPEEQAKAMETLRSTRLIQMKFQIDDYSLGTREPPTSVEWLKFSATVILPPDFLVSGKLGISLVDCPAIPEEVIENTRNPKRHQYFLPSKTTASAEQ